MPKKRGNQNADRAQDQSSNIRGKQSASRGKNGGQFSSGQGNARGGSQDQPSNPGQSYEYATRGRGEHVFKGRGDRKFYQGPGRQFKINVQNDQYVDTGQNNHNASEGQEAWLNFQSTGGIAVASFQVGQRQPVISWQHQPITFWQDQQVISWQDQQGILAQQGQNFYGMQSQLGYPGQQNMQNDVEGNFWYNSAAFYYHCGNRKNQSMQNVQGKQKKTKKKKKVNHSSSQGSEKAQAHSCDKGMPHQSTDEWQTLQNDSNHFQRVCKGQGQQNKKSGKSQHGHTETEKGESKHGHTKTENASHLAKKRKKRQQKFQKQMLMKKLRKLLRSQVFSEAEIIQMVKSQGQVKAEMKEVVNSQGIERRQGMQASNREEGRRSIEEEQMQRSTNKQVVSTDKRDKQTVSTDKHDKQTVSTERHNKHDKQVVSTDKHGKQTVNEQQGCKGMVETHSQQNDPRNQKVLKKGKSPSYGANGIKSSRQRKRERRKQRKRKRERRNQRKQIGAKGQGEQHHEMKEVVSSQKIDEGQGIQSFDIGKVESTSDIGQLQQDIYQEQSQQFGNVQEWQKDTVKEVSSSQETNEEHREQSIINKPEQQNIDKKDIQRSSDKEQKQERTDTGHDHQGLNIEQGHQSMLGSHSQHCTSEEKDSTTKNGKKCLAKVQKDKKKRYSEKEQKKQDFALDQRKQIDVEDKELSNDEIKKVHHSQKIEKGQGTHDIHRRLLDLIREGRNWQNVDEGQKQQSVDSRGLQHIEIKEIKSSERTEKGIGDHSMEKEQEQPNIGKIQIQQSIGKVESQQNLKERESDPNNNNNNDGQTNQSILERHYQQIDPVGQTTVKKKGKHHPISACSGHVDESKKRKTSPAEQEKKNQIILERLYQQIDPVQQITVKKKGKHCPFSACSRHANKPKKKKSVLSELEKRIVDERQRTQIGGESQEEQNEEITEIVILQTNREGEEILTVDKEQMSKTNFIDLSQQNVDKGRDQQSISECQGHEGKEILPIGEEQVSKSILIDLFEQNLDKGQDKQRMNKCQGWQSIIKGRAQHGSETKEIYSAQNIEIDKSVPVICGWQGQESYIGWFEIFMESLGQQSINEAQIQELKPSEEGKASNGGMKRGCCFAEVHDNFVSMRKRKRVGREQGSHSDAHSHTKQCSSIGDVRSSASPVSTPKGDVSEHDANDTSISQGDHCNATRAISGASGVVSRF